MREAYLSAPNPNASPLRQIQAQPEPSIFDEKPRMNPDDLLIPIMLGFLFVIILCMPTIPEDKDSEN